MPALVLPGPNDLNLIIGEEDLRPACVGSDIVTLRAKTPGPSQLQCVLELHELPSELRLVFAPLEE